MLTQVQRQCTMSIRYLEVICRQFESIRLLGLQFRGGVDRDGVSSLQTSSRTLKVNPKNFKYVVLMVFI